MNFTYLMFKFKACPARNLFFGIRASDSQFCILLLWLGCNRFLFVKLVCLINIYIYIYIYISLRKKKLMFKFKPVRVSAISMRI